MRLEVKARRPALAAMSAALLAFSACCPCAKERDRATDARIERDLHKGLDAEGQETLRNLEYLRRKGVKLTEKQEELRRALERLKAIGEDSTPPSP